MKTPNFMEIKNMYADELFAGLYNLSTADIEKSLMEDTLDVTGKPSVFIVERKMRLPMFAADFYHFIYKKGRIPTQQEFIDYYQDSNSDYLAKVLVNDDFKSGLVGRLCRTYPSLVRDIHLFMLMREQGFDVEFNLENDLFGKVDILVLVGDVWYGLKLRVKTRNSKMYADLKDGRGAVDLGYEPIELLMDLDKGRSLNTQKDSIKLYDDKAIDYIKSHIMSED